MPQDNWDYGGLGINGSFVSIAVGPDGNLYTSSSGGAIAVYNRNGGFVGQRGTNFNVMGIALDSATNLYVLDANGTNLIVKFSADGNLAGTFAARGTNDDQVIPSGPPSALAVGKDDRVYIADSGNRRVQVYDRDGNHLCHWGEYAGDIGGILGRFSVIGGIAALPDGDIVVRNNYNGQSFMEMQRYDPNGVPLAIKFIGQELANENRDPNVLVVTPDGLVAITRGRNDSGALIDFIDFFIGGSAGGDVLYTISVRNLRPDNLSKNPRCMAFDKSGTMYVSYDFIFGGGNIYSAHRHFPNNKFGTNALPLPYILSAKQRTNSSLVDIDYRVVDADTTNVTTALLAFVNNGNDFSSLRKPTMFVDNTETNKGQNIAANTDLRLTWNAAELATSFTNLQFEVLAKDNRGLLILDFITIPPLQGQPALTMSRSGISNGDLLPVWYWLIATNDPAIVLTNGVIKGVGGGFDQQSLTSGTATTAIGRTNIYQRLNVRAPSPEEIARAASGNYRFISVDANNVVKLRP